MKEDPHSKTLSVNEGGWMLVITTVNCGQIWTKRICVFDYKVLPYWCRRKVQKLFCCSTSRTGAHLRPCGRLQEPTLSCKWNTRAGCRKLTTMNRFGKEPSPPPEVWPAQGGQEQRRKSWALQPRIQDRFLRLIWPFRLAWIILILNVDECQFF